MTTAFAQAEVICFHDRLWSPQSDSLFLLTNSFTSAKIIEYVFFSTLAIQKQDCFVHCHQNTEESDAIHSCSKVQKLSRRSVFVSKEGLSSYPINMAWKSLCQRRIHSKARINIKMGGLLYSEISIKRTQNAFNEIQMQGPGSLDLIKWALCCFSNLLFVEGVLECP